MDFAPVVDVLFRRSSLVPIIGRKIAKRNNTGLSEIIILMHIHSLTTDISRGVPASRVAGMDLYKMQSVYLSLSRLHASGLIENRKRVKSARLTIYITAAGFSVLEQFKTAILRTEREKFGSRPDKLAQAKGGRISRKPKK